MAQRKDSISNQRKQTQRFIPRRDLFPEDQRPSAKSKPSDKEKSFPVDSPLKPVTSYPTTTGFNPTGFILLFVGFALLWPKLRSKQPGLTLNIQSTLHDVIGNPQSLQMLQSIGPYLEEKEQDVVYTVTGLMEAMGIIREILDHSYHRRQQSMIMSVPLDPLSKKIEMMKVLKPYVPENNQPALNNVVRAYDAAYKLNKNIEIYRNNRTLSADRKMSSIESINEILKVIRPIFPHEYQEKVDRAIQMMKMAEAMEATDMMSRDMRKEKKKTVSKAETVESRKQERTVETPAGSTPNQAEQVLNSFKSMLNDEQKESVDVIMKMAQLLGQSNHSENDDDTESNHP